MYYCTTYDQREPIYFTLYTQLKFKGVWDRYLKIRTNCLHW